MSKKRYFTRTPIGQYLLHLGFLFSAAILVASVIGGIILADLGFYTKSEEAMSEDLITNQICMDVADHLLQALNSGAAPKNVLRFSSSSADVYYWITDQDGKIIVHNCNIDTTKQKDLQEFFANSPWTYERRLWAFRDPQIADNRVLDVLSFADFIPDSSEARLYTPYTMRAYLMESDGRNNQYQLMAQMIHIGYQMRYVIFGIAVAAFLLMGLCLVQSFHVAGRTGETEECVPGLLQKIPYDLYLGCGFSAIVILCVLMDSFSYFDRLYFLILLTASVLGCLFILFELGILAVGQLRCHTLWRGSITYRLWRFVLWVWRWFRKYVSMVLGTILRWIRSAWSGLMNLFHNLPMVPRTACVLAALCVVEFILLMCNWGEPDNLVALWILERLILIPLILYGAILLRKLAQAGEALAQGDLNYKVDTGHLFWDLKRHAENLNSIGKGMAIAVEERLKSERMKTELITNVSHDIKTPLTSIINYGGLIGEETCDNPKIQEYADVMVRQSVRLKRLLEDLVEASKASTGNLEVDLAPCDASIFLSQAGGEYEEKLAKANLTLITKEPEKELYILADGRRMWRTFDNLMNNICKYSLPGSRVYMSLEEKEGNAVITLKNTSREPLDISEEELMERFVRGDSSRNTEGNGLGLSIARSMAELQGGKLNIVIDGDLFKAILSFPAIAMERNA